MQYKREQNQVVIRLDIGDEVVTCVTEICRRESIDAAAVQGIGYTDHMVLRIYDREKDEFLFQTIQEPMEITSLTGNVVLADNGLYTHLHIMTAGKDLAVKGGHLMSCNIALTGELVLTLLPEGIRRGTCSDRGLGTLRFE